MPLHPSPSSLAIDIGQAGGRKYFFDAIADNFGPGIRVSEHLPIDLSHRLLSRVPDSNQLVVTDSPENWTGFRHVGPESALGAQEQIQAVINREDRRVPAMVVFDVSDDQWSAELLDLASTLLRQGRSAGVNVLIRGNVNTDSDLHVSLALNHDPDQAFPAIVANSRDRDGAWISQLLQADLQTAAA